MGAKEARIERREPLYLVAQALEPDNRHDESRSEGDWAKNAQGSGGSRSGSGKEEREAEDKAATCRDVQPGGGFKQISDDTDVHFGVSDAYCTKDGSPCAHCKRHQKHALSLRAA